MLTLLPETILTLTSGVERVAIKLFRLRMWEGTEDVGPVAVGIEVGAGDEIGGIEAGGAFEAEVGGSAAFIFVVTMLYGLLVRACGSGKST